MDQDKAPVLAYFFQKSPSTSWRASGVSCERSYERISSSLLQSRRFHLEIRVTVLLFAMSIVAALRTDFARIPISSPLNRRHRKCPKIFISLVMKDDSMIALNDQKNKKEDVSKRLDGAEPKRLGFQSQPSDLRFDRLQPLDEEVECKHKRVFGRCIAREALLDEEFWEFHAIKRRCTAQHLAEKSTCIIAVKKEETNVKRTVLSSIVGTLDINIRHLLCGETFPGERMKTAASCSVFGRKDQPVYGYIANLSVAKCSRRQGIASNMLLLAVEVAKAYANEVFVHVYKDNVAAWKLYEKLGFEIVEKAISQSVEEQKYLLCLKA